MVHEEGRGGRRGRKSGEEKGVVCGCLWCSGMMNFEWEGGVKVGDGGGKKGGGGGGGLDSSKGF